MNRTPLRAALAVSERASALGSAFWIAILLSGALVFFNLRAHAQTFTTPTNVSGDMTGFSPQATVDSAGNIDVAYLDTGSDLSSNSLWLARGTFSGGSFHALSAPVQVTARAGSSFSMALESDCVIDFAYADAFGVESNDIWFAQSTDCGATFKAANVTNHMAGYPVMGNPQLVINNGVAEIVWPAETDAVSLSSTILYAQRQSAGSFTAPVPLGMASSGLPCLKAFAVPGSGNTAVGWCDSSKGNIWFLNSVKGGQPVKIGTGQSAQFAADSAGNVYIFWDDANYSSIWFSRSSGPTGGFAAAKALFPVTGEVETAPQAAIDSHGDIDLLLSVERRVGPAERSADTIQFSLGRSTDGGNNFSSPVSIVTVSCPLCGSGVPAQMAVDSAGDADVAWQASGGWSPGGFSFSRSNAQATSFSAPVVIPAHFAGANAGITTDASNHVLLFWTGQGAFISQGSAPPGDSTVVASPRSFVTSMNPRKAGS